MTEVDRMAVYKLDVEKKFGQLRFRLAPQAGPAGDFSAPLGDMKALLAALDEAWAPLDTKTGADAIVFRNIEYAKKRDVRETVRLSKF